MHEYHKAKRFADRIVQILSPHCSLIHIAGSVSREVLVVKDIEIVCLPKVQYVQSDLFGGGTWQRVEGFEKIVHSIIESVVKGNVEGRYMQAILKGGITMDLFMPQAFDYYRILAMRTGPADYSKNVIAAAWVAKGWCGTEDGLRRILDCTQTPSGWKCWRPCPELPPAWLSEEDFFKWLGIPMLLPKARGVKQRLNQYQ
jgi:DNA polymerase/3'-5' exonuclease PolX